MHEAGSVPEPPFDLYRFAFLLAALTAIRAIGFPLQIWQGDFSQHASELIFGFMLLQLFGFMLKALPRRTGGPILTAAMVRAILIAQAVGFLVGLADLQIGAQLRALIGFAAVAAISASAIRSRCKSTYPLLALAAAHAGTGILAAFKLWPGAIMLGFCLILAICLEVGNRIFPMVVDAGRMRDGMPSRSLPPVWLAHTQQVLSMATLVLWAFDLPYTIVAFGAGISGLVWLIRIAPWQAFHHAGVAFMTLAVTAKRLGFLLLSIQAWPGSALPIAVPLHVLAIGGLASLAVAIATSIVRKRNGRSFQRSILCSSTYACLAAALLLRLVYALSPEWTAALHGSQAFWISGFCGYAMLLLRRARPG